MMPLETIRRWLLPWLRYRAARQAKRHAQRAETIRANIAAAKAKHKAWRPMLGALQEARSRQLAAELGRPWR